MWPCSHKCQVPTETSMVCCIKTGIDHYSHGNAWLRAFPKIYPGPRVWQIWLLAMRHDGCTKALRAKEKWSPIRVSTGQVIGLWAMPGGIDTSTNGMAKLFHIPRSWVRAPPLADGSADAKKGYPHRRRHGLNPTTTPHKKAVPSCLVMGELAPEEGAQSGKYGF